MNAPPGDVSGTGEAPQSYIRPESLPYPFCPGCGHTKIAGFMDEALQSLGRPRDKVVVVTDIGCVGLTDRHFATNAFHGLHGRSITYASGIKLARPELTVVVVMGDGGAGIGGAHLLAAARRNIGITVVVANNFNFGMTGGQHSCTSPMEAITSTTPKGNLEAPLDLCATLAPSRPGFLARTSVFADEAPELLARALATDGFSLVDVWDLCVAYYAGKNPLSRGTIDDMMSSLEMPPGVIYEGGRPEFARAWRNLHHGEGEVMERVAGLPASDGPDLSPVAAARLEHPTGVVIAGSAGQFIRSAATLLGAGGIMSGLYATQKDDYPITVRTGHSAAEVLLSSDPIDYTGIEAPDAVLILSSDGLSHLGKKPARYPAETRVYVEEELGEIDTPARMIRLPFKRTAKAVGRSALAAVGLGAVLTGEELYPPEAFLDAAARLQKEKVADLNRKGFEAGASLLE